jgi:hypothetical protein
MAQFPGAMDTQHRLISVIEVTQTREALIAKGLST